jgi:hypothetical protein
MKHFEIAGLDWAWQLLSFEVRVGSVVIGRAATRRKAVRMAEVVGGEVVEL